MQAYGFDIKTTTESSCVAELMKMYQTLTEKKAYSRRAAPQISQNGHKAHSKTGRYEN